MTDAWGGGIADRYPRVAAAPERIEHVTLAHRCARESRALPSHAASGVK